MRLDVLEHGHGRSARLFLRVAELVSGQAMDDVVKTAMHRPRLWGRPFFAVVEAVMRGPSFWTPAEREYMGALVSRLNECPFCLRVHTRTTQLESRGEVDTEDASTMRPELAAVLPLLEKMTTAHESLPAADIAGIRDRGVPDDAIVDALHVGFVFNTVNRMANAFGWSWNSDEHVRVAAQAIHRLRYKLPGFVMR
jgi:AhpD family alkylhydroperoxidase